MYGIKRAITTRMNRLIDARLDARIDTLAQVAMQVQDFRAAPPTSMQSAYDRTKEPADANYVHLAASLAELGVVVREVTIDLKDFKQFLTNFHRMRQHYQHLAGLWLEKCLEHYVTFAWMGFPEKCVHVDVAAAGSPWGSLLRRRGVGSWCLDMAYPAGLHGDKIGADAANTGLPAGFADRLTLHCAYECFLGEADVRFLGEARRISKPGSKLGIVPLYIDDVYFISVSPYCDLRAIPIDAGAQRVWRDDGHKVPFSRHYSPQSFVERVWNQTEGASSREVLHFVNLEELRRAFPGQRLYCYLMLLVEW